jgi:hypothetical protein
MADSFAALRRRHLHPVGMTRSAILALLLTCGCAAENPEPLCVLNPAVMPESWRPAGEVQRSLSAAPWSAGEAKDAEYAARRGLDELSEFFAKRPAAVAALGEDAVEPFIDGSYAAANMPSLQLAARDQARRVLTPLLAPYLGRPSDSAICTEYSTLLTLTVYAHALLEAEDARLPAMVALTNAAYRACGSIAAAMGYDYRRRLAAEHLSTNDVWDILMWSITFTDAQLVPGLELPTEARDMPPALWRFLARHPLAGARAYPKGASDRTFYDTAYLATHIAYVPTGYGRHPIYIADAPGLYRFLRQNFYAVLEMGELDLVAEFVDLFRQYGCTERDDLQLRDGTRYLLKLFHTAGDHWMAHREPYERADVSDYDAVHKAWTGMAGVRVRVPEPAKPGTYGGVVRQWLGYPR